MKKHRNPADRDRHRVFADLAPVSTNELSTYRAEIEEATEQYLALLAEHHPERATVETKAGTELPRSVAAPTTSHHLAQTGLMA